MRRRQSLQEPLSAARQYDLFVTEDSAESAPLPEWATLSEETRQTLTSLLTRLILDHASADHARLLEEAQP
jgi:hypothetical protein